MATAAIVETSGKVVISNIGLMLSGDIQNPILEADTIVVNDGKIIAVPIEKLSKEDQQYLENPFLKEEPSTQPTTFEVKPSAFPAAASPAKWLSKSNSYSFVIPVIVRSHARQTHGSDGANEVL